jgi:hypothetical protein
VAKGPNRLTRDNSGKITSVGGDGATVRGGRLKTASGKLRARQVASLKGGGGRLRGGAKAPAKASNPVRKLSRDQRIAANEARTDDVKRASSSLRERLPKKMRDAYKASTVGGMLLKLQGKNYGISGREYVGVSDLIGPKGIKGVRTSVNPNRLVSISMTPLAKTQAKIAEKAASRPRRSRPKPSLKASRA